MFISKRKYKKLEDTLNYVNNIYLEQQKKDSDEIESLKNKIKNLLIDKEELEKNNFILSNSLKNNYTTVNLVLERNQELKKQLESYQDKT